jgi:hypothetical protein
VGADACSTEADALSSEATWAVSVWVVPP